MPSDVVCIVDVVDIGLVTMKSRGREAKMCQARLMRAEIGRTPRTETVESCKPVMIAYNNLSMDVRRMMAAKGLGRASVVMPLGVFRQHRLEVGVF